MCIIKNAQSEYSALHYKIKRLVHKLGVVNFLGVPFNIASYALLTHMVAQVCDLEVGEFVWTGGDCHIYQNHREQAELQLTRSLYTPPTLTLNPEVKDIFAFEYDDISVNNYESHPTIKAKVAV